MLKINNNLYNINGLKIRKDVLLILRPDAPQLGEGVVCCSYDAKTHICSNGKKQFAGQVPWPSADLLLADQNLSKEVDEYLSSLNTDIEEEYCLLRRKSMLDEYSITDQLDVILKTFNQLRLSGTPLPQDMDDLLGHWTSIKKIHPKPEPKEA